MKQDPKLLAAKQKYEVAYIAKKFGITQKVVREITAKVGRSRGKIYAAIKLLKP